MCNTSEPRDVATLEKAIFTALPRYVKVRIWVFTGLHKFILSFRSTEEFEDILRNEADILHTQFEEIKL